MNKYIIGIDGMKCGMCEAHVKDLIRNKITLKKIKASHIKNTAIVITPITLNEEDFVKILDGSGYRITSFEVTSSATFVVVPLR